MAAKNLPNFSSSNIAAPDLSTPIAVLNKVSDDIRKQQQLEQANKLANEKLALDRELTGLQKQKLTADIDKNNQDRLAGQLMSKFTPTSNIETISNVIKGNSSLINRRKQENENIIKQNKRIDDHNKFYKVLEDIKLNKDLSSINNE